jgi:hypothetical protein
MAVQTINIGNIANDGTGDNLRQAFQKVNTNFADLDQRFDFNNTIENLGTGEGVFYTKENNVQYYKSLKAGNNISLSSTNDEITISSTEAFTIQTDSDSVSVSGTGKFFGIKGGTNIDTTITSNDVNVAIDPNGLVALDTSPTLGGTLNANSNNITNVGSITANSFIGNVVGTVNGVTVTDDSNALDFGGFIQNVTTVGSYIIATTTIDYGSFTSPASLTSDFGSI